MLQIVKHETVRRHKRSAPGRHSAGSALGPRAPPPRCRVAGPSFGQQSVCEELAFFRVELSERTLVPVEVDYHTQDGSAVAGDDYVDRSGTLTFEPGDWVREIAVPIVTDKTFEHAESFDVVLSDPVNATLGDNIGVGRVRNDDTKVMLSSANVGDRRVDVAVSTRWEASGRDVDIYRIVDGPNRLLLESTLDSHGALSTTTLAKTFGHGTHVGLYAMVTTDAGEYRSKNASVVIP